MQHRFTIDRRRHVVHALFIAVVAAAGAYLAFTGFALAHIAERQSLLTQTAEARSALSRLESGYLFAAEGITPSLALERGMTIPQDIHFVTRKPLGKADLSLAGEL